MFIGRWLDDTRPSIERDAVARQIAVGAGGTETAHSDVHDLRVDGLQGLVAEPTSFERAWSHCFDNNVSLGDEFFEQFDALFGLQVEDDGLLAPVAMKEQERIALDDGPGHNAPVVAAGGLNLDDFSSKVRKRSRHSSSAEERDLNDANSLERFAGAHRPQLALIFMRNRIQAFYFGQ
jgi:hypothetical protein